MVNEPRNDQLERQYWIGQIPRARGIYDSRSHFNLELANNARNPARHVADCRRADLDDGIEDGRTKLRSRLKR